MVRFTKEVTSALFDALDEDRPGEALVARKVRGYMRMPTPWHKQSVFTALALLPAARQREIRRLINWSD